MKKNIRVRVADASGNITIFVLDKFQRNQYQDIATQLLSMEALGGEQVAFVTGKNSMDMCGLEFCGNASLSLAAWLAKEKGLTIPVVYNSSGYETVESLQVLRGLVDVYLPDCKYFSPEISKNYSNAGDYFEVAAKAIEEMVCQVGEPVFDEVTGNMIKGVIVRHLFLPEHTKECMDILEYLRERYKN